jgi:hypothetical protein
MTAFEIIQSIASITTAVGVGIATWQIFLAKRQGQAAREDSFAEQYRRASMISENYFGDYYLMLTTPFLTDLKSRAAARVRGTRSASSRSGHGRGATAREVPRRVRGLGQFGRKPGGNP